MAELHDVRPDELAVFRAVGSHLARRGLISGSEGNLSTFDGSRLVITRTGSRLDAIDPEDVVVGTCEEPPPGASSDLPLHLEEYGKRAEERPAAIVHAHPPGTVPPGWVEGQAHGVYASGHTLDHAAAVLEVRLGRTDEGAAPVRLSFGGDAGREPTIELVDQTRLPVSVVDLVCETVEEVADAIRRLAVRGAPALGVTAGFGVAMAALRAAGGGDDAREAAVKTGDVLVATRPTAVNIRWAVDRVLRAAGAVAASEDRSYADAALAEARAIEREDGLACSALGWAGAELIPEGANVLTHCNTGMLCTAGIGTAFGVLWCAHLAGKRIHVWADETRPLLQGARLTAWELQRLGLPYTVIADSAAGSLMAEGRVDAVILGADRIAANGDVANKVGTYPLAVLAERHGVPFYVAAPTSTVDLSTPSGDAIAIEARDPEEVTHAFGTRVAPEGAPALNPAFDVTPAELITAIVMERGVFRPPFSGGLAGVAP